MIEALAALLADLRRSEKKLCKKVYETTATVAEHDAALALGRLVKAIDRGEVAIVERNSQPMEGRAMSKWKLYVDGDGLPETIIDENDEVVLCASDWLLDAKPETFALILASPWLLEAARDVFEAAERFGGIPTASRLAVALKNLKDAIDAAEGRA